MILFVQLFMLAAYIRRDVKNKRGCRLTGSAYMDNAGLIKETGNETPNHHFCTRPDSLGSLPRPDQSDSRQFKFYN
jgi:hypothetical protein